MIPILLLKILNFLLGFGAPEPSYAPITELLAYCCFATMEDVRIHLLFLIDPSKGENKARTSPKIKLNGSTLA